MYFETNTNKKKKKKRNKIGSIGDKWTWDYLDTYVYTRATHESVCVRLSTKFNRTGCATYPSGNEATLRYAQNQTDIDALILDSKNIDYDFAVVMPLSLISSNVLTSLRDQTNNHCQGIIFLQVCRFFFVCVFFCVFFIIFFLRVCLFVKVGI